MARYVDCHLHLQDPRLVGSVDDVIDRARQAGVARFVCNGTCPNDWPAVLDLARQHEDVVPCFGLHPWSVPDRGDDWLTRLEEHLRAIPSVVGEIGLDQWVEPRDEPAQEEAFVAQLDLAQRLDRPVVVHCLRAWGWLMDVLRREELPSRGFHLHAYNGPVELLAELASMGAYFSFSGTALQSGRRKAHRALRVVPPDRLLTETDAPDMPPPESFRSSDLCDADGRAMSQPADLPAIVSGLAELLGADGGRSVTAEDLAAETYENARRFYGDVWQR